MGLREYKHSKERKIVNEGWNKLQRMIKTCEHKESNRR